MAAMGELIAIRRMDGNRSKKSDVIVAALRLSWLLPLAAVAVAALEDDTDEYGSILMHVWNQDLLDISGPWSDRLWVEWIHNMDESISVCFIIIFHIISILFYFILFCGLIELGFWILDYVHIYI